MKPGDLTSYMPLVAAAMVSVCAGLSVATYEAPIYAIVENTVDIQESSPDETEEVASRGIKETIEEVTIPYVAEDSTYADGTYEGSGTGFSGKIEVSVEIVSGKISNISVTHSSDEDPWFSNAKGLIERILENQTTNIDVVSGATYSSRGIIEAVRDALDKASGGTGTYDPSQKAAAATAASPKNASSKKVSKISEPSSYKDGRYTGSATGFGGKIVVSVTISGGKIASIDVVSHNETASYFSKAKSVVNRMISKQSTNVDTVSGATYSSAGLINAVRSALSKASNGKTTEETSQEYVSSSTDELNSSEAGDNEGRWKDGIYVGRAEGFADDIEVEVEVKDSRISSVRVTYQDDTPEFFSKAEVLTSLIVEKQSSNVDAVSGATYSSNGIIEAVRIALEKAHKAEDPTDGQPIAEPSGEQPSAELSGEQPITEPSGEQPITEPSGEQPSAEPSGE